MSKTIIFIPGKNPKPEPEIHYAWLWRCLLRGVQRVAPRAVEDLRHQPGTFKLGAWNHSYYRQHAAVTRDEQWIDQLVQRKQATQEDINEALSWHKGAIKLMYEIGDRFHKLIPWIPDQRIKSMIADTEPYFENKYGIANRVRNIAKSLIVDATENHEQILLIGHSLGSMIAYEAMWELTHVDNFDYRIELFLTLGSPLGMRYVQKHLLGFSNSSSATFPGGIQHWKNVSAHGDLVSVDEKVSDDFGLMKKNTGTVDIKDYCEGVFNWYRSDHGLNVHRSYGYLVNPIVGKIIADWWTGSTQLSDKHKAPGVIAHRGYPSRYPENTLIGFQKVMEAGARMVELDIQFSADGVPVLHHDADTRRMSGVPGSLLEMPLAEIRKLEIYFPERFGDKYRGIRAATLAEFCELLQQWPEVQAFVEIKEQSIEHFGLERAVDAVMREIHVVRDRCIIISFSDHCVEYTRSRYKTRTGWVLSKWSTKSKDRAAYLAPEFLFVAKKHLPQNAREIWRGAWKWVVYVVDEVEAVLEYPQYGIDYVETDVFCDLIKDPRLRTASAGVAEKT